MQIKYISLGLLVALVASTTASDTVGISGLNVKAHNTASGIANNLKIKDVLNDARVNVASTKRGVLSRRDLLRAVRRVHRRSENEPDEEEEDENEADENENEPDEEEADENENEPDEEEEDENENEPDEEEADENENEPDEEEADENEVNESGNAKAWRR
ncbi:hypothetical protein PS15m_010452 [Mucor circinelloides]